MLPSTLFIMWPMHLQSFKVAACPTVKEEMHLQENYIIWPFTFGLDFAQYPLMHLQSFILLLPMV